MKLRPAADQEVMNIMDSLSRLIRYNPKHKLRTIGVADDVKMVKKSELLAGKSPEDINRS